MKKKLSINLPTNNPGDYFSIMEPSLKHLQSLLPYCDVEFSFVFQKPWKNWQVESVIFTLNLCGFSTVHSWAEAKELPSMTYLRYKGLANSPDADYYMFCDDNFEFRPGTNNYPYDSGIRYGQCLTYLEHFCQCGFVMCEGSLGGSVQKLEISSTKTGFYATSRGLIIRNIGTSNIFRDTTHLLGGLEESVACYHLIERGYFPAKQFNNPTLHKHLGKVDDNNNIHDNKIWDNNCAWYIRDRYYDPNWDYQKRKLPRELKEYFKVYGGDPEVFKKRKYKIEFQ